MFSGKNNVRFYHFKTRKDRELTYARKNNHKQKLKQTQFQKGRIEFYEKIIASFTRHTSNIFDVVYNTKR